MKPSLYPPGATNINWYNLFNAISFQMVLGAPMILYAKSLGASVTTLGVISALPPLLIICQIPAARFFERIGYKRFVLYGWSLRTLCIFAIAFVPLAGSLSNHVKIWLILALLFIFNLLRGISAGAWMPWVAELVPDELRARFLSRDMLFTHAGCFSIMLASALVLGEKANPWQFSVLFFLSACAGWVSLVFIKAIPDIESREKMQKSNLRVPWVEIVTYPPFLKLTLFSILFCVSVSCSGVFGIAYLKSQVHLGEDRILFLTVFYFVGALMALPFAGRVIERIGSKKMMFFSTGYFTVNFVMWALFSSGMVPALFPLLCALYLASGIAGATFAVAQSRLIMKTMPVMGRSHFFAFFSVISNIWLGVAPVFWGMMIDALGRFSATTGPVHWNKFSIYYCLVLGLTACAAAATQTLHEKEGPADDSHGGGALMAYRLKRLMRFWQG